MRSIIINYIAKKVCKHFGHKWRYIDYSHHIKANGDPYDFSSSRNCIRCGQYSYLYADWKDEARSQFDYESNYFARRKPITIPT
ncbi:MAG: hypothetical protein ABI772_07030 [Bacteroidota bacterium]